jgi:biopolymer transport protein ExbB/TolQ
LCFSALAMYDCGMLSGSQKVPRKNKTEALDAAMRTSARSAAVVHREMKRGLNGLATISSTAPWVGLFGAVLGVYNSFGPINGSKESIMAEQFERLSQAFTPCAFGLIVALTAMWCCKYLLSRVEAFDLDMENASLQLINDLSRLGPN